LGKTVDVINQYNRELMNIKNKLIQLENGRVYDLTGVQMDGYLATNIVQLREMIEDLIYKIEYGEESINERLKDVHRRYLID